MIACVVKRDSIHAAQRFGKIGAVAGVGRKRHFAIGVRFELVRGKLPLQFDIIIDLAIGDQRRAFAAIEGLVAGGKIYRTGVGLYGGAARGQELGGQLPPGGRSTF